MTPDERQDRLDVLSDWDRALLLAYLDGRVPAFVDEWFARRKLNPTRSADS